MAWVLSPYSRAGFCIVWIEFDSFQAVAILHQFLDPSFGLYQPFAALPGKTNSRLKELEALLERQVAALEFGNDLFELGKRGFKSLFHILRPVRGPT